MYYIFARIIIGDEIGDEANFVTKINQNRKITNELIYVYIGIGFVSVLAFILAPKYIKDKKLLAKHWDITKKVLNFAKQFLTKK